MTLGWCCRGCDYGRPCEFYGDGKVRDNVAAKMFGHPWPRPFTLGACRCICHLDGDATCCGNCG